MKCEYVLEVQEKNLRTGDTIHRVDTFRKLVYSQGLSQQMVHSRPPRSEVPPEQGGLDRNCRALERRGESLTLHVRIQFLVPCLTENETPFLSYSIYFHGRITYIVIIAELHMKLVSECTERVCNPAYVQYPGTIRETPNRTYYDENTNIPTMSSYSSPTRKEVPHPVSLPGIGVAIWLSHMNLLLKEGMPV